MNWIEKCGLIYIICSILSIFIVLFDYKNFIDHPQKIECYSGYQVLVSNDKGKEPIFLIDKYDKKIPCR